LIEEKPAVEASMFTQNRIDVPRLDQLLEALTFSGSVYTPDEIELGGEVRYKARFDPVALRHVKEAWATGRVPTICEMRKEEPVQFSIHFSNSTLGFSPLGIRVEQSHFSEAGSSEGLLDLLESFYRILDASYGRAGPEEMRRRPIIDPVKRTRLYGGTNLARGIPEVYWANFFGPEYVEMFGPEKIFSAPCYEVKKLKGGGALLLLSQSALDYLKSPKEFERIRERLKEHLGREAFDTGNRGNQGKVPTFRHLKKESRGMISPNAIQEHGDLLSTVSRADWEKWITNNSSISRDFVLESQRMGLNLDYSYSSLKELDNHIQSLKKPENNDDVEIVKRIGAYLTQVVIRETGAKLLFPESDDTPSLKLGEIWLYPLSRAQKAVVQGEKLEAWYRFLKEELMPKMKSH
jgi:hypothetical protein